MDIINPEIIVRGKRFYRSNIVLKNELNNDIVYREYDEEPCDSEEYKTYYEISQKGNDFYSHMHVPSMFIGFVIGKGGESKKRIEFETQTVLTIPKMGTSGPVNVKGKTESSVDRALTRIAMLIDHGRSKSQFTHFLSIQVKNDIIKSNFENFKDAVLKGCVGDRGVQESVFQRTYKLHLTICVMVLADQNEVNNAIDVCHKFQKENLSMFNSVFKVRIRGIDCMNDDPCEVRVLYGKVELGSDCERLQTMADSLVTYLVDQRVILRKEFDKVTLHMTLMNSNYNQDKDMELDCNDDKGKQSRTIDCSNIIKKYSDWDFGIMEVSELELSKRHTVQVGSYYQSVGSMILGDQ